MIYSGTTNQFIARWLIWRWKTVNILEHFKWPVWGMVKEKTPSLDADGTKLSGIHSYHHEQGKRKRQAKHLLSGGIAGAVSRTCVSPLERVKILFQIQVTNHKYVGVADTLKRILKEEGFKGFFKGNGTNVLRIFPYTAVQFAAYEEYKKLLGIPDDPHHHTPGRRLVAGALAGMTSVTATYPLDLVRTRLAAQGEGQDRKYRNIKHAFQTILKEEGGFLNGCLYRGWSVTVVGIAPYVGLNFAFYETLKGFVFRIAFPDHRGEKGVTGAFVKEELPVLTRLGCGGLAGAMAQSITYPLDVVRRRFQMRGISGTLFQYTGLFHAFTHIFKTEGYRGLYKGMWPNLLKVAPLVGIQFVTYEIAKAFMHGHPIPLPWR